MKTVAVAVLMVVALQLVLVHAVMPPRFRQTASSGVKKTMCSDFPGMSGCAGSDAYACQSKKNPKDFECVTDQRTNPIYRIPVQKEEQMPRERWSKCIQCVIDDYAMKPIVPTKKPVLKLTAAPYKGTPYECQKDDTRCPLLGLEWEMQQTYVHLVDGDKFVGCQDHSVLCKNDQYKTTCDNAKETRSIIEMVTKAYQFGPEGIREMGEFKKLMEDAPGLLKIAPTDGDLDMFNDKLKCQQQHPFLVPISGWTPITNKKLSKWDKKPTPKDIVLTCEGDDPIPMLTAATLCKLFNSPQSGKDVLDLTLNKQMKAVINGNHESMFPGWGSSRGQWTGPVRFEDWIADMMAANPKGVELCQAILGTGNTWAHKFCVFKAADAVINGNCLSILDTRETYCKDWWGLMPRISPRQMAVLIRDEYKGLGESDFKKIMEFDCAGRIGDFIKDTHLHNKAGKPKVEDICKLWKEDGSINMAKHEKAGFFQPFKLDGKVYMLIEGRQAYLMEQAVSTFVNCKKGALECFHDWYASLRSFSTSDFNQNLGFVKKMLKK